MHLLLAQKGTIAEGGEAIDLGQSPADVIFLSAADTEIASLAGAAGRMVAGDAASAGRGLEAASASPVEGVNRRPSLRLANLLRLSHPMSVDSYVERTARHAKLVVVRLLGGTAYWPYGLDALLANAQASGGDLAVLPGDDRPDPGLDRYATIPPEDRNRLWRYLVEGGAANAENFLLACRAIVEGGEWPAEAQPLLKAGLFAVPGASFPLRREVARPPVGAGAHREAVEHDPDAAYPPLPCRAEGGTNAATAASLPADPPHRGQRPVAAIVFYRALVQSGQTEPVEALARAMAEASLHVLPVFVTSLKDEVSVETLRALFRQAPPSVVVNLTGFAVSSPGAKRQPTVLEENGAVVLQAVLSSSSEAAWRESARGLSARDLAMNVALPEVDGRILSRAIAFKQAGAFDALTETDIVAHGSVASRVGFVAELAANWARLRAKAPASRRVAIILANYPNRDGRLGNGVGLDTPAGTIEVLGALREAGYDIERFPADGNALIDHLMAGPTNAGAAMREIRETLPLRAYRRFFEALPQAVRDAVTERWGAPEDDPFIVGAQASASGVGTPERAFALPLARFGNVMLGIQPARGYNVDPKETYHSPDLVPPHNYLAFYAFLRETFAADAAVHMGKHGNLEWLPGKALALSQECFPESLLGPLPHLYPFIVNDPGEGTQAKRRASAVIIDHLTPPLTRAESYGALKDLEALVDEYYEAAGTDPRRLKLLKAQILDLVRDIGLDIDAGIAPAEAEDTALEKLDAYLCELKEMQIRDGLHVFGRAPEGRLLTDLVVALARLPRGTEPSEASLHRAIAADLGLDLPLSPLVGEMSGRTEGGISAAAAAASSPAAHPTPALGVDPPHRGEGGASFDPLDCNMAVTWPGPKPSILADLLPDPWRTNGDTVERIELLASQLVSGKAAADGRWTATRAVLADVETRLEPSVVASGPAEIAGLLAGLDGRFVAPGPSGAPTRGRPDVLPTGRNFFSVDTRSVPTQAAYTLGKKSAELLVTRHLQDHGEWPTSIGLTAWGTSNMRTGGDDIAQAFALIGAKPVWDMASRRVRAYEIVTLAELGRPRVDVTLRISGFFRDAFPYQIALFDRAIRAVGALDEEEADNPIAARMRGEKAALMAAGAGEAEAEKRAGFRIFGSKPGAYGAGLQALIDEKGWTDKADLAESYLVWGSYAYGADAEGSPERETFEERLSGIEAVVQNQDNREHDLLDSDDYYQFEGGMTAAVEHVSGRRPTVYHNDHSRPERPVVRTLEEEIGRVVRARVVNPKWIAGVIRHGYKGAFEIAATVDYMFAFAATTGAVRDHHFESAYRAFVADDEVRAFMLANNRHAFAEMSDRLAEAIDRGLWTPRSNSARAELARTDRR